MGNPTMFFEVLGRDRAALERFYSDLFGWQTSEVPGPIEYSMVAPGKDGGIAGGIGAAPDGGAGHVTFYAAVDDVQAALDKAGSLGGQTAVPPLEIPGGQVGLLADPEGHVVGVWNGEAGDGGASAGAPVVHFEVVGKDGAALRSFYGELFGWDISQPSPEMDYGLVEAPDGAGIPGGVGAAPGGDGHVTVYVGVDDLQATLDRVASLGGQTVMPPMEVVPGTKIAQFSDPEGHMVGLSSS